MCELNKLIGKTFIITDPDFEGCQGTIVEAFTHFDDDLIWIKVEGEDFSGIFHFGEGYILEERG